MTAAVSVDELQRAWAAVEAGEFRSGDPSRRRRTSSWHPTEPTIVVAGATGRVGASTVAVTMATAAQRQKVRVVECSPMHATGLAAATTAELGVSDTGWRRGMRDQVLIERTTGAFEHVDDVPAPDQTDSDLTIIDTSWNLNQIATAGSWLANVAATAPLLIVSVATAPGLRALATALQLTALPDDTWCVVLGPATKKWPKPLHLATTGRIQAAIENARLSTVPVVPSLSITGLTPDPLPPHLVTACASVFDQMAEHAKGNHHDPL